MGDAISSLETTIFQSYDPYTMSSNKKSYVDPPYLKAHNAHLNSRLDLLVRVRYLNPIPPPPFPPKLFNLPTNVHRLGEPSYLDHLASSTPLPMLVDSEMGMPLVLNNHERIWEGRDEGEHTSSTGVCSLSAINPTLDPNRVLDPADVVLLAPSKPKIESTSSAKAPSQPTEVSWMRSSNLFARKGGAKREALKALE